MSTDLGVLELDDLLLPAVHQKCSNQADLDSLCLRTEIPAHPLAFLCASCPPDGAGTNRPRKRNSLNAEALARLMLLAANRKPLQVRVHDWAIGSMTP
jgi:hypothetical protein